MALKRTPLKKKLKKPSVQLLKKKAWTVFSLWIRNRDADDQGMCTCITCGARKPIKEVHAGHGIGGRHNYLLFDEKICNAQCPTCNIWKGGEYEKYAVILIKRYGLEWYEDMTKYKLVKYDAKDYQDIIERYSSIH